MAFTLDNIIFSPTLEPISVTHTVGFGSSLEKTYTVKNNDPNEVKINIKVPTGIKVEPSFVQLAPNQSQNIRISADRTFFDTLPKGANRFNVEFQLVGQGDPIDPTSDVIVYELQLTSSPSLSLKVGQTSAVTAQVLEKNLTQQTTSVAMNKIITFDSSNPGIITVGQLDGQARAVSPGNAEITVTSQGIGTQRVLVGVFSDPPAPRWWEKIVVNTTSGERFYQGPFYRNIEPYPTREIRNGQLYDVYYQEISEDHIKTTTYYYDWKDVTDSVQGLTDTQKLQAGYISSTSKPVIPSPQTVDGGIIRVVTNSKWEQKIILIPTPSQTPVPPTVTPTITPTVSSVPITPLVTPITVTPTKTPTASKPIVQYTCWTYKIWFDQASIEIYPPPSIDYTDCSGNIVNKLVDFNSTASNPQTICARNILNTYRTNYATPTAGCSDNPPPAPTPTPTPTKSGYPDQTIAFSVSGGNGTLNGRRSPFTVTIPWGTGYSVNLTPDPGYECDQINIYNATMQNIGKVLGCSAMVYAGVSGVDDVVGSFKLPPQSPNPTPSYNSTSTGTGGTGTGGGGGTGTSGGGGFIGLT